MSDLDPSDLTEIIRRALDSRVNDIHVSLPGRVEAYYSDSQTVDVTPMVTRPMPVLDALPSFDPLPVLPNVRVSFPRSKKFSITWPLEPGDEGAIHFCGWDIAPWLASGDVSDPIDLRNHHPMHAFFVPGICSDGNVITPDPGTAALVVAGADVRLGAGDASDFVALASLVKAELDKIVTTLGTGATATGGGAVTFATPYTSSPVAATLVKAK